MLSQLLVGSLVGVRFGSHLQVVEQFGGPPDPNSNHSKPEYHNQEAAAVNAIENDLERVSSHDENLPVEVARLGGV